jgi:hypothetical protein
MHLHDIKTRSVLAESLLHRKPWIDGICLTPGIQAANSNAKAIRCFAIELPIG